jgi:ribonuclease HI
MQQILHKVASWGQGQGLRFSAAKSVAIAFTRKQNWTGPQLSLNNTALPWQTNVKYLGVLLHHRLSWSDHIAATTKKAKWLLFKYKNIVGSQFGPQPRYMRWMYTGIVRPALIYGSLVWWRSALERGRLTTFTTISRLALLTFAAVRSSTPTIGLEVMGYLPPMDLFLEGEVTKAWLRIKSVRAEIWDGIGSHSFRGHRLALQKLTNTFPLPTLELDEMAEFKKWTRSFQVDQDFSNDIPRWSTITCFTTGAQTKGRTGSGFVICQPGPVILTDAFPMGTAPSKFQAEMTAIFRAAEALQPLVHLGHIVIHSDSQAVVLALNQPTITSKTTLATILALETLATASNSSVKVAWASTKSGSTKMRMATELANRGALLPPTEPEPVVPPPKTHIISAINAEVERRWNQRWTSQPRPARQIRLLWPTIDQHKSLQLLRCDRQEYGDMVKLLTGHNYLNRHSHLLDEAEEDICRLCYEDEESSEHLLFYCPALDGVRLRVLGQEKLTATSMSQVPLDGQRRLILLIRQSLLDGGAEQI